MCAYTVWLYLQLHLKKKKSRFGSNPFSNIPRIYVRLANLREWTISTWFYKAHINVTQCFYMKAHSWQLISQQPAAWYDNVRNLFTLARSILFNFTTDRGFCNRIDFFILRIDKISSRNTTNLARCRGRRVDWMLISLAVVVLLSQEIHIIS